MARYISTPSRATGFANRCVYSTPGSYTFTVPDGVTSIKAITVGGGAPGSSGFVEDYSQVSQIVCPGWKSFCASSDACLSGYRCYGYGFCARLCLNGYAKRSPYLLDKFAFGYTGSGGGYAEKTIAVTPGDSFCITVGDQEETSSFFGSSGCLSATGATTPTVVRTSNPCKYGWNRVDSSGNATTDPLTFCICECQVCTPSQSSTTEWQTKWCMQENNSNSICYKYSETLDCPVLCLTSLPGCGIGGDVNYTGGPSKTFSVKTLATSLYEYGCPNSKENCQCYWSTLTCQAVSINAHNWGSHSCTNCNGNAWDNIINAYSTYDDIENDCIGGACAVKLSGRNSGNCGITNCLYCSARYLTFFFSSRYDTWEGYCCCCYMAGYKMPAFKQFSADKQFLEANQGGSSSGSPLGNGCSGGIGCTLFGAETDSLICQGNQLCGTELSSCGDQWSEFFTQKPWIFCCADCGYTSFNYFTCCPSVAFFDRYTSPFKYGTKAEFQKEFNPVVNLNCDETIMNPSFTLFPWRDKAGCVDTGTNSQCCQQWWSGECYWSCSGGGGCETANYLPQDFAMFMCFTCCPGSCQGVRFEMKPMAKYYCCPKRYDCSSTNQLEIWLRSQCYACNCCCGSCYNNCCLTGTSTNWVDAICNQCLIRENTTVDDVIDYQTAGMPWVKDYWNCFKYCAEGETANDDHKKSWCVMCGMWNAMLYHLAFANPSHCISNHYCNCQDTGCFAICKNIANYSCFRPSSVNYGTQPACIQFRCQGCVKSKVISSIDTTAATIIPGSAGGPNAEGQSGYVLGDEEILIAGTGADKSGSTQPQYILTSSGASMSKATFDKIRSTYHGDLMAWYLNECWKPTCTTYANGGTNPNSYGQILSLETVECCGAPSQAQVVASHYLGTCCHSCCFGGGTYCLNSNCVGDTAKDYGMKLYACANAEFIRKFNLHTEYSKETAGGATSGCERTFMVVDVGSSGGIVIAPKSKAFSGDPLCINTGGGSSTTSYAVGEVGTANGQITTGMPCLRWQCCGQCCSGITRNTHEGCLTACIDDNQLCRYHAPWSCMASGTWALPYFKFGNNDMYSGPYHGNSRSYMETSREVGGGGGDIFINEKYIGSTLADEYLFSAQDPVFGGTGQICVNGSTLYSLPGLTQGGSVGGCIVKGNETQSVPQTAYSGGIFPKGAPGYGGGGTVCGEGGSGLIVVYWN